MADGTNDPTDITKTDAYINLALKLAPAFINLLKAASDRDGKSFEDIAAENGVKIDEEEALLLADIATFQAMIAARNK